MRAGSRITLRCTSEIPILLLLSYAGVAGEGLHVAGCGSSSGLSVRRLLLYWQTGFLLKVLSRNTAGVTSRSPCIFCCGILKVMP
jgi:hypothetical protein